MIGFHHRQALALALVFGLLLVSAPWSSDAAAMFQAASLSGSDYSGQGIPYTPDELQNLVAPVALYPDSLLAQVLVGATFPDQVLLANIWVQQNKNLPDAVMLQAINSQSWDPSVKGLAQFPAVLNEMAQNLVWASMLGEAYHNQSSATMASIQLMRGKAKTDGNLHTGSEMILSQPSGDIIMLQPVNPTLVYVPQYNPTQVYGTPITVPEYTRVSKVSGNGLYYGVAVGIGGSTGAEWSWKNWQCNWYHGTVDFRSYPYYGNHAWRGGYYGGFTYYGNHPYHDDANRPFNTAPAGPTGMPLVETAGAKHNFSLSGTGPTPTPAFNAWAQEAGGWAEVDILRGWGKNDPTNLTAFSSWSSQAGNVFGVGGWGDRSASYRGWLTRGGNTGWGIGGRSSGLHW
jgi:hypothetical protein